MPTGGGFKVACFGSGLESACCTSDLYLAQCYDPFCEECVVDSGSSTGYGGVFPKSCVSGAICLGCYSGGTSCPGECKCQPGVGCGCFTPGTYSPIACTGGGCFSNACYCCLGGALVRRYSLVGDEVTFSNLTHNLTSFAYSYTLAACSTDISLIYANIVKTSALSVETIVERIPGSGSLPISNYTVSWSGTIHLEVGEKVEFEFIITTPMGQCSERQLIASLS